MQREYGIYAQGDGVYLYKRAIADFDMVTTLAPGQAKPYNQRGMAYALQGDDARALADFNKAIELDPNDFWPYYNRGMIYKQEGKKVKAIADFNKAISLTDDPEVIQRATQEIDELSR